MMGRKSQKEKLFHCAACPFFTDTNAISSCWAGIVRHDRPAAAPVCRPRRNEINKQEV